MQCCFDSKLLIVLVLYQPLIFVSETIHLIIKFLDSSCILVNLLYVLVSLLLGIILHLVKLVVVKVLPSVDLSRQLTDLHLSILGSLLARSQVRFQSGHLDAQLRVCFV